MTIKEYKCIYHLKDDWLSLYNESTNQMSPLQSYEPNRIFFNAFYLGRYRWAFHPRFIFASDGDAKLIIPITINRAKKKIREFAPLDYYDIVSTGSLNLVKSAIDWIKTHYPDYSISFSRINYSSSLLSMGEFPKLEQEKCVYIPLKGQSYENYFDSLTKHQRQNIRTAYNKLKKENIIIAVKSYDNNTAFPKQIRRACAKIYVKRYAAKNSSISFIKRFYRRLSLPVFKMMEKIESGAFIVLFFNEEPVAYMAGAYTKDNKTFVVPMLFSNNDFIRYSPGIILINEAVQLLISQGTESLDLARGTEAYKYAMGGKDHFNYSVVFSAS